MRLRCIDTVMYRVISRVPGTTGRVNKMIAIIIVKFRF